MSEADLYGAPPLLARMAREALTLAAQRDNSAASAALERIFLGYGHQGMYYTLLSWCDTALDALGAPRPSRDENQGRRHLPSRSFIEASLAMADVVNPPAAWAGALVLARADWDTERCKKLYADLRLQGAESANLCIRALVDFVVVAAVSSQH